MKLTLRDISNAVNTISNFKQSMHIKLSYRFSKLLSKFETEMKLIEKERKSLIEKYGVKNQAGEFVILQDNNNLSTFIKEFDDFLNEEYTLDDSDLIPFDLIENSDLKFSPIELHNIDKLLKVKSQDNQQANGEKKDDSTPSEHA